MQVEKHILVETNKLIKSIQVMLNALNELRLCYVMERAGTAIAANKQESLKVNITNLLQKLYFFQITVKEW